MASEGGLGRASARWKNASALPSVQLSESMDEESSAALEAEFSHGADEEELGEGLGALEPDLDELRPRVEQQFVGQNDGDRTRVAVLARLAILEGPDAGKEVPFIGIRMVLGRASNLEIPLTDLAVSRRHVEFVRGENGVLLRDLGSGNGTLINGQRVTEQILSHHDVVTVGSTKLRYISEAEAHVAPESASIKQNTQLAVVEKKKPAREPPKALVRPDPSALPVAPERRIRGRSGRRERPKKKKWLLLMASAGGLLCLLVLAVLLRGKEEPPPQLSDEEKKQLSAQEFMTKAREAARQKRFGDALQWVDEAEKLQPGIDVSNLRGQAEIEWNAEKGIEEVKALLAQQVFKQAREVLDKIPEASASLNAEKKGLLDRLIKEEQQFHLQRSEELLMLGDFDPAIDVLRLLPRGMQTAMGEKIALARASYEEAKRLEQVKIRDDSNQVVVVRHNARLDFLVNAFMDVRRKFSAEDWKRAADECDRAITQHPKDAELRKIAKELQRLIPEFGLAYDEGASKYRAGQIASSAVPLSKAYALYGKIHKSPGMTGAKMEGSAGAAIEAKLKEMLSQASLLAGEDALARGDFAAAAAHCKEAQRLQPKSERANKCVDRVVAKAEDLFGMGYSLRASDPKEAQRYFKLIITITPKGSLWSEKAKNQLNAMAHKSFD
ncbi:MAG: FHA domain-containing protein [Cystobacterineae bacterium]|nr:FHA domain-containing protein [Cystobacterineae bacterium]